MLPVPGGFFKIREQRRRPQTSTLGGGLAVTAVGTAANDRTSDHNRMLLGARRKREQAGVPDTPPKSRSLRASISVTNLEEAARELTGSISPGLGHLDFVGHVEAGQDVAGKFPGGFFKIREQRRPQTSTLRWGSSASPPSGTAANSRTSDTTRCAWGSPET